MHWLGAGVIMRARENQMLRRIIVTGTIAVLGAVAGAQPEVAPARADIAGDLPGLVELYKDLHQHPELSFQEKETSRRIAGEMRSLGFDVTEGVGGYGVVCVLRNGDGPTVMIRTDLDALPIKEQTGVPWASNVREVEQNGQEVSVMHACGHDVHMTVFVGTGRRLVREREHWSGTLVMIGQPAEERGAGAKAMLVDGLFERFPRPDYNLAIHVAADLPAGSVAFVPEWAMANVDSVDITVHGIGGHGSAPHTTIDPIVIAASIVVRLQTIVSREIDPLTPAVVTVGSFHGGTKHNIISERVDMQLTVRSYDDATRAHLLSAIERIAKNTARAAGVDEQLLPEVVVKDEFTPSLYNDPDLTARVRAAVSEAIGQERIYPYKPIMGGEDFSRYGRQDPPIPSVMFRIGGLERGLYKRLKDEGAVLPSLHTPYFSPELEPTLITGIEAMSAAALEVLDAK